MSYTSYNIIKKFGRFSPSDQYLKWYGLFWIISFNWIFSSISVGTSFPALILIHLSFVTLTPFYVYIIYTRMSASPSIIVSLTDLSTVFIIVVRRNRYFTSVCRALIVNRFIYNIISERIDKELVFFRMQLRLCNRYYYICLQAIIKKPF